MPEIPNTLEDITREWLSDVIGCTVTDYSVHRIGEDKSFTGGSLYRFTLSYADNTRTVTARSAGRATLCATLPETIVVKISPTDKLMRSAFAVANQREVEFYTRLAPGKPLPVPECFFGGFDPASGASVVLLEDLIGAKSVGFLSGCSVGEAELVVDALAAVHGQFWNAPDVAPLHGASLIDEFDFTKAWETYPQRVAQFLPGFVLPCSFLRLGDYLAQNRTSIFTYLLETAPMTCLHRDIHVDNVLYQKSGAALLDWQFSGKGKGAYDLCYFCISSLNPEVRRGCEDLLISRYCTALRAQGIDDYCTKSCWHDYVLSVAGKIFITVIATTLLNNSGRHKTAWRKTDLMRLLAFCDDHAITRETLAV